MSDKKKILWISDHPLVPSGVGTQSKYIIEGLLDTGKYSVFCLGGAVRHPSYELQVVAPERFNHDWKILPVNGYGDKELLRKILASEKPDALVFFTDPRFFIWLWEMEDEVHQYCPMVYYHVWDDDPTPIFNRPYYDSTDHVMALSLKTFGLLQDMNFDKEKFSYNPHAVCKNTFKPLSEDVSIKFRNDNFGQHVDKKFFVFWNNRNARRKMTGDVIGSFAKFAKRVGKQNTALVMHTDPRDQEGQDILAVAKMFDIDTNLIISSNRVSASDLNYFYNACDCTLNISNNEGFGLGTLESIMAGTPIAVNMTGGLQFQVGDWWKNLKNFNDQEKLFEAARNAYKKNSGNNWWGEPIFPASRSCTGSQQIPFIYADYVSHDDVADALEKLYNMGRAKRKDIGLKARDWAINNFSMENMISNFDKTVNNEINKFIQRKANNKTFSVTSL